MQTLEKKPPQFSLHKNNGNKSTNTKPPHFLKPNSTNPKFHKIFNNKKSIPRSKTKPEKENAPGWEYSSCPGERDRRRRRRRRDPWRVEARRRPPDPSGTFPSHRSKRVGSASQDRWPATQKEREKEMRKIEEKYREKNCLFLWNTSTSLRLIWFVIVSLICFFALLCFALLWFLSVLFYMSHCFFAFFFFFFSGDWDWGKGGFKIWGGKGVGDFGLLGFIL